MARYGGGDGHLVVWRGATWLVWGDPADLVPTISGSGPVLRADGVLATANSFSLMGTGAVLTWCPGQL